MFDVMFYHVTDDQWDGTDLVCLDRQSPDRNTAVRWFMQKWGCEDEALADDQVTKVHLYRTLSDALRHKAHHGGEILEIDGRYLDVYPNYDGHVYVWDRVPARYIAAHVFTCFRGGHA